MGGFGGIRTLRNQSSTNGSRTLGSILASNSGLGPASFKRLHQWAKVNDTGLMEQYNSSISSVYSKQMHFTH